ncbi:MAG: D-aminoacyl-tRNA deacylase [Candidatus Geothermarchaeales archaeon]
MARFEANGVHLRLLDRDLIGLGREEISERYDIVIFLSRHRRARHVKSLTVHATGNFGENVSLGGRPRELSWTAPAEMRRVLIHLRQLVEERGSPYRVSYEAAHHGPTDLSSRSFFVEIVFTSEEWRDREAADVVGEAVSRSISTLARAVPFVGIGGGHYAPTITSFSVGEPYAAGHIISKYTAKDIGQELILEALEKSDETNLLVLEKKGVDAETKAKIQGILDLRAVETLWI